MRDNAGRFGFSLQQAQEIRRNIITMLGKLVPVTPAEAFQQRIFWPVCILGDASEPEKRVGRTGSFCAQQKVMLLLCCTPLWLKRGFSP